MCCSLISLMRAEGFAKGTIRVPELRKTQRARGGRIIRARVYHMRGKMVSSVRREAAVLLLSGCCCAAAPIFAVANYKIKTVT